MPRILLSQSAPSRKCAGGNSSAAASWRRQGIGEGWKAKTLWYCLKWSISRPGAPPGFSHLYSLPIASRWKAGKFKLTSVWVTQRGVTNRDIFLTQSLSLSPVSSLCFVSLSYSPKTGENKEERQKKSNITSWPLSAEHTRACLASDTALPVLWRPLISLWFHPNGSARWQMLNFPSVTLTPISLRQVNLNGFVWTVCLALWMRLWLGCWCVR